MRARGFSLLEVLISISFLTIVVVTVLQCMSYCFQLSVQAEEHWRDSLSKWNQSQELRSLQSDLGNQVTVIPAARPMFFVEVSAENEASDRQWGVLRAAK